MYEVNIVLKIGRGSAKSFAYPKSRICLAEDVPLRARLRAGFCFVGWPGPAVYVMQVRGSEFAAVWA